MPVPSLGCPFRLLTGTAQASLETTRDYLASVTPQGIMNNLHPLPALGNFLNGLFLALSMLVPLLRASQEALPTSF